MAEPEVTTTFTSLTQFICKMNAFYYDDMGQRVIIPQDGNVTFGKTIHLSCEVRCFGQTQEVPFKANVVQLPEGDHVNRQRSLDGVSRQVPAMFTPALTGHYKLRIIVGYDELGLSEDSSHYIKLEVTEG